MACCSTGCGSGCGGGYGGGYGGGTGNGGGGALVDNTPSSVVNVGTGGCSLIIPGPSLRSHDNVRVCCQCVCASECCMPCGGCCGGHGENGPGSRVDISHPCYDVMIPGAWLCSNVHCARASASCCCDPCCGPC